MRKFFKKTYLYLLAIPVLFTVLGAASNQIVLFANNDKFPVMMNDAGVKRYTAEVEDAKSDPEVDQTLIPDVEDGMMDQTHCFMTSKTHLNFLADVFDFGTAYYSVGDGLLFLGGWAWTFMPFVWGFAVVRKLRETSDQA
jgi:hypothetical protein